jgi:acyl-coenzyme A thioesterase PaaI-like protein
VSDLIERITRFRDTGDGDALTDIIPYAGFLGISAEGAGDRVTARLRFADHLIGNPALPALHGGTTGALLETAAVFQVLWQAESVVLPKIINITVQYLRSGKPVDTLAQAFITKQGRRVVAARAEAWQGDRARPIATATAHFLVTS